MALLEIEQAYPSEASVCSRLGGFDIVSGAGDLVLYASCIVSLARFIPPECARAAPPPRWSKSGRRKPLACADTAVFCSVVLQSLGWLAV